MRVEIGRSDTTVSGDLYKVRRFDDLVIGQADRLFAAPLPIIPIKPRNRYFSYLRVVGISSPPVLTQFARILPPIFNPCTISLTVEEFRYTHPTAGQANGSFPRTPTRTLVFVLTKAAVPAGFQGPAFEGDVFENGLRLPLKVSLFWVSEFFRRARLELENVTGVAIPGSVGAELVPVNLRQGRLGRHGRERQCQHRRPRRRVALLVGSGAARVHAGQPQPSGESGP